MELAEYIIFFALVVSTGAGIPGPGDAAMITAGTLAGEGRLNIGVVVVTSLAGWMLGSLAGYAVGLRGGRALLDHPGRLQDRRRKLLAKGDAAFGRHTFTASVTLPRLRVRDLPGAAGRVRAGRAGFRFLLHRPVRRAVIRLRRGGRQAHRRRRCEGGARRARGRRRGAGFPGRVVQVACQARTPVRRGRQARRTCFGCRTAGGRRERTLAGWAASH